jgi:uncharacterized protein (TIGR04255 family)
MTGDHEEGPALAEGRHPSFHRPSVIEALCEVHFRGAKDQPWQPSLYSDVYRAVSLDYPNMEPVFEVGLQVEVGPSGIGQKVLPPRPRMRFRHASRPQLLQLAEGVFTANFLDPYPGWGEVRQETLEGWRLVKSVIRPEAAVRIGLRYINRIEKINESEQPGEWFRSNKYVPAAIMASDGEFLSRTQFALRPGERMIVTVGDHPPTAEFPAGFYLFDIDRIAEKEGSAETGWIESELEGMHEDVWSVFEAAASERLIAHMKGAES